MSTIAKMYFTPEDLEQMPDAAHFELVDGQLVERHMGYESSLVVMRIGLLLGMFMKGKGLGNLSGPDAGFRCYRNEPGKLRRPDLCVVLAGRLPAGRPPTGDVSVVPDLAVEVISPGDLSSEIDVKVDEYCAAGVRLIWIVKPHIRRVHVFDQDAGTNTQLRDSDTITAGAVLPGFSCGVAEFFPDVPAAH